ncbi:MAG: methyltransferase domain-containing protein [Patescibacteria group bacterium]
MENEAINAQDLIRRLGGTIKIGIIEKEINRHQILKNFQNLLDLKHIQDKFKFGISHYGRGKLNIRPLGMEVKKYLKENGKSARWVISKEPTLSSVVVEQNKLTGKGIEFVLISHPTNPERYFVGRTLAVQPFKELSFRDFGRPARDDYSGMLPPKLAQIMINLSGADYKDKILDPFCGSGTVIMEALLMGYSTVLGSDISEKAINDTKKNTEWVKDNYQLSIINYQFFKKSATELSDIFTQSSIGAIVTEPYLGPQRGNVNVAQTAKGLEKLYSDSLLEFRNILKPGGRITMIWPILSSFRQQVFLNPKLHGLKIINPIPEKIRDNRIMKLTGRSTMIYGREGQKVWREIVVLEK